MNENEIILSNYDDDKIPIILFYIGSPYYINHMRGRNDTMDTVYKFLKQFYKDLKQTDEKDAFLYKN